MIFHRDKIRNHINSSESIHSRQARVGPQKQCTPHDLIRSVISPTTRNASGRSCRSSTKAGWRRRLPPNNIRLPILLRSSSWASSVRLNGADDLTESLKPNQLQSVRQPLSSQLNPLSSSHEMACVGKANPSTSSFPPNHDAGSPSSACGPR